jgi:hypothetical protein
MRILVIILCASALNVQARLMETSDQCIKRYGEPDRSTPDKTVFSWKKSGIQIMAHFVADACVQISYTRLSGIAFSNVECTKLMSANANGKVWSPFNGFEGSQTGDYYLTQDDSVLAEKRTPTMMVFKLLSHSPTDLEAVHEARDIAEGKKLEGF